MSKLKELISLGAGHVRSANVEDYQALGGYKALEKAMGMGPKEIIAEVLEAKLLGRGGAAYPAGKKWAQLLDIPENPKYIVCNADEGEPGTFKDKLILDKVPLRLIEGMTIAAYVFSAQKGYIYVRGEYRAIQKRMVKALQSAREHNLLGESILGSNFSFDIEIVSGAGAYVCGENSALLNSTQGTVGRPRIKPPHLAEVGLFLKPTLVNNVESFSCIPSIVLMGGKEFLSLGHPESGGTKLICLSGHSMRPGIYEVPLGKISLREAIFDPELGGGVKGGRFKFAHLGGQSGPIVSEKGLDITYSYTDLRKNGLSVGSGAIVVLNDSVSVLEYLKSVIQFFIHESCGKCVPCREGGKRVLRYLLMLSEGKMGQREIQDLKRLLNVMRRASFCGLGQSVPVALLSAFKEFPECLIKKGSFAA